ncbi:broad-complex core protein isoforms 1/2/3/4/5-like [Pollicipes pollicipes]|uniref:broad-complex core protein isoforms 1/2/3/4/5-like n=1 Tax=Pollicipes pollicipes TaxID=41117 RepID=UPI0018851AD0|nr:broad-complex core protein isoforms 1/2/3/4/5-like [Pollicipes pollicipes]
MNNQKFCLKWDGFQSSITSVFDHLRQDEELVDITLCCEGQRVKAHRMMLSACSPYFRDLFKDNPCQQMVFFLKDTSAADLRAIIEFMYKGSVNVSQTQLASFIKTAEMLQIRGLSGGEDQSSPPSTPSTAGRRGAAPAGSPPAKRTRRSGCCLLSEPHFLARQVEKEDLAEDGDVSLDTTLGYVAEYEGSFGEQDLSIGGHDGGRLGADPTAASAAGRPGVTR